ncbi:MAG: hypothetical protein K6F76_03155 [Clostridiales bacterium]|nr:hypothetical protein [Clostridiales bacterium]
MSEWNLSINYGIKTGCNDAFIITTEKRNELIATDPKSAEIIRPILRGRDINRYQYSFANLWLIFLPWHFPLQNDVSITGSSKEAEEMFAFSYPAVYNHLLSYKPQLSKRNKAETGIRYEWYALQRWGAKYWNEFFKQKIVYREISDAMNACLVDAGYMLNNKCYLITGEHLLYILSFINSKLFTKIVLPQANTTGGKGESFLKEISLILPSEKTEEELSKLYNLRQEGYSVDEDIEKIFCSLYELTDEETKFIME